MRDRRAPAFIFLSVSYGGWPVVRSITNALRIWQYLVASQRIITSPFLNLSTLVRRPGKYANGQLDCRLPGIHHQISEWLLLGSTDR